MDSVARAKYLIANNDIMTIATADSTGKPWISPVGSIADDQYNLFWVSSKDTLHSNNIRNRPEVAIVIVGRMPDGRNDGVYFDAMATEVTDRAELSHAIEIFRKRPKDPKFDVNSLSDVTGAAVWRIYRATPLKIWKRADATQAGQAVTIREPIELV